MDFKREARNLQKSVPDLFFRSSKKHAFSKTVFTHFYDFWHPPDFENRAKTLYCRSKSKVPAFVEKTLQSWKRAPPWPPKGTQKPRNLEKNPTEKPLEEHPQKKHENN